MQPEITMHILRVTEVRRGMVSQIREKQSEGHRSNDIYTCKDSQHLHLMITIKGLESHLIFI